MRKLTLYSIQVLLLSALLIICFHKRNRNCAVTELHPIVSSEPPENDHPELAMQQEFEATKDPALGYVPKDRLYKAYLQMQEIRKNEKKTHAAIPNIAWAERGPNNIGGRTEALMFDPTDATGKAVFAGAVDGGLWHTTDITAASPVWTATNDFFNNMAVTTIACNKTFSTTTIYFGTGEGWFNTDGVQGNGIWKSTDGGVTWAQLAATTGDNFYFVQKIQVDAAGNVYAATRSSFCNQGGLFKSTDGGVTWSLILGTQTGACNTSNCWADDIEIAKDGTLYASIGGEFEGGVTGSNIGGSIYKSTNSGTTWTLLNTGGASGFPTSGSFDFYNISIGCDPSNAGTVYALTGATAGTNGLYAIYKSVNAGATWATLPALSWQDACAAGAADFTRGQAWYDLSVAVDPNNANNVWIGGVDLMRSTNGGTSFTQMTDWNGGCFQKVHADQHVIVFSPITANTMIFGNDGGVWYSSNANASPPTISSRNSSYNVTQFYSVAINPTSGSNEFLCGAQDNGNQKFSVAGMNSTVDQTGGDGAFCHIDQLNQSYQFAAYVYANFYVSQNGGATWNYIGWGNNGQFIDPTDFDKNSKILYGGWTAGQYIRFTNPEGAMNAAAAVNINAAAGGGNITAVTVSPNNANRVWFGISNGRVVRVDAANGAAVATSMGAPAAGSVSCVCVQPGNENNILVTYSSYGVNHVYQSANGGTTWTDVWEIPANGGAMSDMPVWWAMFNPWNNTTALVATDLGVWSTNQLNGVATNWGPSNGNLCNSRVYQLQYRSSDGVIAAATHGRGLFTTDGSVTGPLPVAMVSFTGTAYPGNNLLNWSTASEVNNDHFDVERSTDGESFEIIGSVKGSGTTSFPHFYSFTDNNIAADEYYYRLKQVDYDGNYQYSNIVSLSSKINNITSVFPNPFNDEITIRFASKQVSQISVSIYDLTGKLVYTYPETAISSLEMNINLDQQNLSKGVYFLKVITDNTSSTYKIVKI